MDLNDPTAVALAIAKTFRAAGIPYALYGGLLLAAYGRPRETKDADLAVARADAGAVAALLAEQLGIHCGPAFERRPFGGLVIGRVTLVEGDDLNTLDLVEPVEPEYAQRALERAATSNLRKQEIRVLAAEDFVIFKLLSTRELDLEDAISVMEHLGAQLDGDLLRREVEFLALRLPEHPLRERWERIQRPR